MNKETMLILTFIFAGTIALFIGCRKEISGSQYFVVRNNSDLDITVAMVGESPTLNGGKSCILTGVLCIDTLRAHSSDSCFETKGWGTIFTGNAAFYIVDSRYRYSGKDYYSCDSIEIKNKVLKKYYYTQDSFRLNNYTITYP